MNILLINTNPVVSRLVSLCIRNKDTVFEEITDANLIVLDRYDIVFVDDASYVTGLKDILANLMIRKKVFLSSKSSSEDDLDYFDEMIKKPFLPSQITAVLESLDEIEHETEEILEEHHIFPLAAEEDTIELEEPKKTEVLDSSEIERIKTLLEDDGLEIVSEEAYVENLSEKSKNKKKEKKTKSNKKKDKKKKEETFTFEEALIAAIEGMKVKKIKKLLKNAEVTIKINFKDQK